MRSIFFLAFLGLSCAHSHRDWVEPISMLDMEKPEGVRVCYIEAEGDHMKAACMDFDNFVSMVATKHSRGSSFLKEL